MIPTLGRQRLETWKLKATLVTCRVRGQLEYVKRISNMQVNKNNTYKLIKEL